MYGITKIIEKIDIDEYINNWTLYYADCSKDHFRNISLYSELNQEGLDYLNENFNLDKIVGVDKKVILHKLLTDRTKSNFTRHLFMALKIGLEVNCLDDTNKSIFQLLFELPEDPEYKSYFFRILYNRGYINTIPDHLFLVDFYKNKIKTKPQLTSWSYARICFKLHEAEKIEKAFSKIKVILIILSFKLRRPVGYNFPNLLGVANIAITHYGEHGDLILGAMKHYDVYNKIMKLDFKRVFRAKQKDYIESRPVQDTEFNKIVYEIFPELNELNLQVINTN